jgi:hypothetical protein
MNKPKERDVYATAFMLAWEQIIEIAAFTDEERELGYEPMKGKIYELMDGGERDTIKLATEALSWLRDRTQVERSIERVTNNNSDSA